MGSVLYAKEIPETGGDTMFANLYLAYETLSDAMKAILDGRRGVNSSRKSDTCAWSEECGRKSERRVGRANRIYSSGRPNSP